MKNLFHFLSIAAIIAIVSGCEKTTVSNSDTAIRITSPDPVTVSYEGGTMTISYEIENPAEGGEISAAASAGWISAPEYTSAEEINFSVEPNTGSEERTATVTVTYTYGDGKTVDAVANVKQGANSNPSIQINTPEVTVTAAESVAEISFEIINPAENGKMTASSKAEWISEITVDGSRVTFKVAENTEAAERTAEIALKYSFGDWKSIESKATVTQEGAIIPEFKYETETTVLVGEYYGQTGFNGEHEFFFTISDKGYDEIGNVIPGGSYYIFGLFCETISDPEKPQPSAGDYSLGEDMLATDPMTFSYLYSLAMGLDDEGNEIFNVKFAEGSNINISYEGSDMILDAVLVDDKGDKHHVTFKGEATFVY